MPLPLRTGISRTALHNEWHSTSIDSQYEMESSSPEDGKDFQRSLQIDMKYLIGDAVGNMSISPTSRDLVLAAKRGLFIIDLKAPLEVPRFLPQGGTWDVADVQWNPHSHRAEYIVSTSCEKLLIWNLYSERTPIEHILRRHYRAITDINWHTSEPDMVSSTGIDSWIWSWDLRQPSKPAFGLSAFNASGTQVKWNRREANILASSHSDSVLIWDRRKGSLPIRNIKAHTSKIYGIDWVNNRADEILTCSLDKTIKLWDVKTGDESPEPISVISTNYPVWRARDLPFGDGLLSLPQRGATSLEMWSREETQVPAEIFEGHTDVVKEFVWRKGEGPSDFQLITWSKDRTLRFWPVDPDKMEKVGHRYIPRSQVGLQHPTTSFRNLPSPSAKTATISAPVGLRSILAEVRAPPPPQHHRNLVLQPHENSSLRAVAPREETKHIDAISIPASNMRRTGTMSRGNFGGRSVRQPDAFAWLNSVRVGAKREGSSGPGSNGSRPGSNSRNSSGREQRGEQMSTSRAVDDSRETEGNSLQDEITSVLNKLASSRIKLEKHDIMKKRTCTLGLHGPWGEASLVFIRVTFTFPKDYPRPGPQGTPTIDLERNPLISLRNRALILRRLRNIRENRRPCLEACLRYLLFAREDVHTVVPHEIHSESSSDTEERELRGPKDVTVSLLRSNKNLAEPRTSQGVFAPSGHLVYFSRAPRRIIHRTDPEPASPGKNSRKSELTLRPPALLADAIRQLSQVSLDHPASYSRSRPPDDTDNIGRVMANLLTFSPDDMANQDSAIVEDESTNYDSASNIESTIFISNMVRTSGPDRAVATEYVFQAQTLAEMCETNANIARDHHRFDHQRAFYILRALFPSSESSAFSPDILWMKGRTLALRVVHRLYSDLCLEKDIQMLAMISVVLLQIQRSSTTTELNNYPRTRDHDKEALSAGAASMKSAARDYFSLVRRNESHSLSPTSYVGSRMPLFSPLASTNWSGQSGSTSGSSRASWSSIFHTGRVRHLMGSMQDLSKAYMDGTSNHRQQPIPVPRHDSSNHAAEYSRTRALTHDSQHDHSGGTTSRSWSETPSFRPRTSRLSSASRSRPKLSLPFNSHLSNVPTFKAALSDDSNNPLFSDIIAQRALTEHVLAYAEILYEWQLYYKRAELLKSADIAALSSTQKYGRFEHMIGLARTCMSCKNEVVHSDGVCSSCGSQASLPRCSICRSAVKGVSRTCVKCRHIMHISCWKAYNHPMNHQICPSGCGCLCSSETS